MFDNIDYPPDKVWKAFIDFWKPLADGTSEPLLQFMIYFMMFNHLCTLTDPLDVKVMPKGDEMVVYSSSKEQIPRLLFALLNALEEDKRPFHIDTNSIPELMEAIQKPKPDGSIIYFRHANPKILKQVEKELISERIIPNRKSIKNDWWTIVDVFEKINIVRNNLFHGWKRYFGRDKKLILESIAVLRAFLESVLKLTHLPGLIDATAEQKETFLNQGETNDETP